MNCNHDVSVATLQPILAYMLVGSRVLETVLSLDLELCATFAMLHLSTSLQLTAYTIEAHFITSTFPMVFPCHHVIQDQLKADRSSTGVVENNGGETVASEVPVVIISNRSANPKA